MSFVWTNGIPLLVWRKHILHYCSAVYVFVEIIKWVPKSWCFVISFTWFQLDFINFRVFKMILHIKYILTRKIIWFYKLNRDFNNFDCNANIIGWRSVRWSFEHCIFGFYFGKQNFFSFGMTHNWVKQSIFWEFLYWKTNVIRYNLDVMHIKKNMFNNIFNMIMDV